MSERPWTPVVIEGTKRRLTVKRTCENCGREIGDATREELEVAIAGTGFAPVADECGCLGVVAQLAMLSQRYDAMHYGSTVDGISHPTWEELGPDTREEYEKEATNTVRAMVRLGWAPLQRVLQQIGATT